MVRFYHPHRPILRRPRRTEYSGTMSSIPSRIAMVSMHTSPAAAAGSGDAGGMNVSILALAEGLAARGVEVDLLTRASAAPAVTELSQGVVLRELAAGPARVVPKGELPGIADEFGEAVADLVRLTDGGYDLIHAHYWLSGLATLPVALEQGIPLVQSFHTLASMKNRSLAPGQAPEPELRVRSEMYLANQAAAIVAGSTAEVASLIDEVRAPADRVWVIPPGVDVELFRPDRAIRAGLRMRARLGIAEDRPVIAVAGRIQPLKDQELAIRAFAEVHALRGWAPVLVLAGAETPGDEEYGRSLRSMAAGLGVADDVRFVGALSREDLADLFAMARITLMPSRSETFGLVALESAASGTPVIGYNGGGLVESIADGVSGVLIDSRDPEEWASAIALLLSDVPELERFQFTARHHALGFTWGATTTALLGVYSSLL
jgi:D-inositol-3-phosphate glycosyltransferase